MVDLQLVIGDKNYSSWSLRPWVWLKHHQIPFAETLVSLYQPDTSEQIEKFGCGSTVPILINEGRRLWDSLSILEYLAEKYPHANGWPSDPGARAVARSISAEMHSSFTALRNEMPMNCNLMVPDFQPDNATQADITRVEHLWNLCLQVHGQNGPWLFGDYSIADAMFAPVALRFKSYNIQVSGAAVNYIETVLQQAAIKDWLAAADGSQVGLES